MICTLAEAIVGEVSRVAAFVKPGCVSRNSNSESATSAYHDVDDADSISSIFIALDILTARAVERGIMTSIASRAAVASPTRPWPAGGFIRIDELPEDVVLGVLALRPGQACAS